MANIIDGSNNEIISGKTYLMTLKERLGNSDCNLLVETIEAMLEVGKTAEDIVFIGSVESGHSCEWAEYEKLANVEYDNGYGREEVAVDLEIIFNDGGRLKRGNYDGSEWWAYVPAFEKPKKFNPIRNLFIDSFDARLADVNKDAVDIYATEEGQRQVRSIKALPSDIEDADLD